jgi:hypothetical protein
MEAVQIFLNVVMAVLRAKWVPIVVFCKNNEIMDRNG